MCQLWLWTSIVVILSKTIGPGAGAFCMPSPQKYTIKMLTPNVWHKVFDAKFDSVEESPEISNNFRTFSLN